MDDERDEKIRRRAFQIWEREGGVHGDDPEKHWHRAEAEIDREAALEARQGTTEPSAIGATVLSGKAKKPRRGETSISDVMSVEVLAMRTGITGDQAQDLIDRLGDDRVAIEDAAASLAAGQQNFSK
ncbi:DUF2934 domain-containing protein [Mesorhizobium sangaii]|uniref:DUF2934 domain-containing protein n=1 Tax=Mesorhizobium sangaii TaxID=505389 RepID=A0A841P5W9_9HYPH|nr:DUF2934 domain-containing protein [Mesorhizobium sangaii]MBB6410724.1 hypothetical protein [Mesorhizobium sangaii]